MRSAWIRTAVMILCCAMVGAIGAGPAKGQAKPAPTPEEAKKFIEDAEQQLFDLGLKASRASWVQENFITDDTEQIAADANEILNTASAKYAKEAHRYDGVKLSPELARKRLLLELATGFPAPDDPKAQKELAQVMASLDGDYGKGKWCPDGDKKPCLDITAIERLMATSRDPDELKRAWLGWHAVGAPMRQRYARMVELGNQGSKELGYADVGALWRSNYDMPPDAFAKELDRVWEQLRPLYLSLHAYVRGQLAKKYGKDVVPPNGPIPAHLLGNPWAQEWNNVYDLMDSPKPAQSFDLTKILQDRKTDPKGMVKYGENFFMSLGFPALPQTFWERSLFTKPADRDVVCHASAWDVDSKDDLRVKMCILITEEDFRTIHHELGHNFYQRAYNPLPPLFQGSANDGFHEAVGDTIALSVTPEYLKKIGLIDTVPPASGDTDYLLQKALEKVAFLPFGLVIDKWRWEVFLGAGQARSIQPGLVGFALEISGRGAARRAHGGELRSRREIPRARKCTLCPLFPCGHLSVPVSTRAVQGSRGGGAAAPLLDLRQQKGRRKVERHALHGRQQAVAGRAGSPDGSAGNRCHRAGGLFRAPEDLARRAKQKERLSRRLVAGSFQL